jgi:putative DNA-invertase from lambdoid prophage Rac
LKKASANGHPTTILYCRAGTSEQTLEHQITQARAAGFEIADDSVIADDGVSGVSTILRERPQGRRLFDLLRPGDILVVRWVDRLGRNYEDVTDTIREFMRKGVIIRTVINGLKFDGATQDPVEKAVRDAMIGFMAGIAEAQEEVKKEAMRAGIEHAKQNELNYLGRQPSFTREQIDKVRELDALSKSVAQISEATNLTRQTVYRIKANPDWANQLVASWEEAERQRELRKRQKTL